MKEIKGIYVIIDPDFIKSEDPVEMTKKVLDGGAKVIQLRNKEDSAKKTIGWAEKISALCDEYNAISIINDRVDIACLSGADGVHLGQNDIYPDDVMKITHKNLIIGTSNALIEEVEISEQNNSSYIAIGSIFPTNTKTNTRPASIDLLKDAKGICSKPIVAIGGINQQNIKSVVDAGVDSVCIATAITLATDPQKTTKTLSNYFNI
ncbi:MAG: thiamine phosphate synthase [Chloroflexota bacterium]|nr:thiamine phosphate synthase [Chloroflexota bacterium]